MLYREYEGKKLLEIPKGICDDNIKMCLRDIGLECEDVEWIHLAHNNVQW
jgi:hypothetical protein